MEKAQFIFPLVGIVALLTLVGVATTSVHSDSYNHYKQKQEQVIETPTKEKVGKFEIYSIKKGGHNYLFFDMHSRTGLGGVIHDPDCPCHVK